MFGALKRGRFRSLASLVYCWERVPGYPIHYPLPGYPVITRVPEYWPGLFITRLLSTKQCTHGSEFGAIYHVSD